MKSGGHKVKYRGMIQTALGIAKEEVSQQFDLVPLFPSSFCMTVQNTTFTFAANFYQLLHGFKAYSDQMYKNINFTTITPQRCMRQSTNVTNFQGFFHLWRGMLPALYRHAIYTGKVSFLNLYFSKSTSILISLIVEKMHQNMYILQGFGCQPMSKSETD